MAQPNMNPTPTPPDAKALPEPPALIPVASFNLPATAKIGLPGKRGVHNGLTATRPSAGEFWSIGFNPKHNLLVVSYFKPGPDPKRPPVDTLMIPAGMVTWRPAA